jgi:mRNA-degrading endonuclease YafQ of YafQ-DinJ toxin-antitoxin module
MQQIIQEKLELFVKEPFHPTLKNHKLSGNLKGLNAIYIEYDCRLVFHMLSEDEALLTNIGSHDEVY